MCKEYREDIKEKRQNPNGINDTRLPQKSQSASPKASWDLSVAADGKGWWRSFLLINSHICVWQRESRNSIPHLWAHQFKLLGMTAKAHCLYHVLFCSWNLSSREGRISSLVLWEGGLGLNWAQADASLSPVCLVSPQMFFGVCCVELPCKNLRFTSQKAQQGTVLIPFSETQGDILERKWAANSWNWDLQQGIINQT